jgi:hypothetical protein
MYERELLKALNENLEERLKRQLILHEFKAGGYNIPEPILDSAVQEEIDRRGGRERLLKTLQAQGMTFEKFRQQTREGIILGALRSKNITHEIIISPHRIERYYLANQDNYRLDNQVKLRRIMLNNTADGRDAAATRQLAEEIRTKIQTGAAFSDAGTSWPGLGIGSSPLRRYLGSWAFWLLTDFRGSRLRMPPVKPVREPDDRNGHVRFDERGRETERWTSRRERPRKDVARSRRRRSCTPPRASSTLPVWSRV